MTKYKICRRCHISQPLDSYYRCSAVKDGRKSRCKDCLDNVQKGRLEDPEIRKSRISDSERFNNSDKGKKYHKDYKSTNKYKITESKRRDLPHNRLKIDARCAVKDALRHNRLKKKPCVICDDKIVEAHHYLGYDRNNWLNVMWLCHKHHLQIEKDKHGT